MEYYTNKNALMITTTFMGFLRVLDASGVVHGRKSLLLVDSCATDPQDT
jgi:hypothetical protein